MTLAPMNPVVEKGFKMFIILSHSIVYGKAVPMATNHEANVVE